MRKTTIWVITGTVLAWVTYDFAAYHFGGGNATISEVIWDNAQVYPFIAFVAGFVCGHLFWQFPKKPAEKIPDKESAA